MDKKSLRAIPRPTVPRKVEKLAETLRSDQCNDYIFTAELKEEMLIINIFDVGPEGEISIPYLRTFCTEDDYITQDLLEKKTVWKTGALQNVIGYAWSYWGGSRRYLYQASKKDGDIVKKWCDGYIKSHGGTLRGKYPKDYIDAYQEDIMKRRLEIKHKERRAYLDSRMKLFKVMPDEEAFREWVDKEAMFNHNFVIYDWKKKWGYCTRCKHELILSDDGAKVKGIEWVEHHHGKPRHNHPYTCPFCEGEEFRRHEPGTEYITTIAKSIGYNRDKMQEVQWVTVPAVADDNGEKVITIRYVCCIKDYKDDFMKPAISWYECFRSIHKESGGEHYEWDYDINSHRNDWIVEKDKPYYWNPSEYRYPLGGIIPYIPDEDFYKESWAKYSCMTEFRDLYKKEIQFTERNKDISPWFMDQYLNFYRKHKYIEKVIKVGWSKLTYQIVAGVGTYGNDRIEDKLNGDANTLAELLGISRDSFLLLKETTDNPEWKDIKILRYAEDQQVRLNSKELTALRLFHDEGYTDEWEKLIDYKPYTTIHKLEKYLYKLPKGFKQHDYFEYLGWTKELGYDLRSDFNIYPPDFRKKHDERAKEYVKYKTKAQREAVKKFNKLLKQYNQETANVEALNMNIDGLFIRLPFDLKELKKEGETLHHCVETYQEKVMKGQTTILFIRKISEPDKPYYTLEWKDGRVVQCRGFKNCDMTPEVKAFVAVFTDKMRDYEREMMKVKKVS